MQWLSSLKWIFFFVLSIGHTTWVGLNLSPRAGSLTHNEHTGNVRLWQEMHYSQFHSCREDSPLCDEESPKSLPGLCSATLRRIPPTFWSSCLTPVCRDDCWSPKKTDFSFLPWVRLPLNVRGWRYKHGRRKHLDSISCYVASENWKPSKQFKGKDFCPHLREVRC